MSLGGVADDHLAQLAQQPFLGSSSSSKGVSPNTIAPSSSSTITTGLSKGGKPTTTYTSTTHAAVSPDLLMEVAKATAALGQDTGQLMSAGLVRPKQLSD